MIAEKRKLFFSFPFFGHEIKSKDASYDKVSYNSALIADGMHEL